MRKNGFPFLIILVFLMVSLTSCEVIGGIFKAGVWVGVLGVVFVVGLVIWLIGKARR